MVGRYWSRWNPHLRNSSPVPSEVENVHQPRSRSYDNLRCDLCCVVPCIAHGSPLGRFLLGTPPSERVRFPVGELQLTAAVGRVRDLDVLHRFAGLLVHGSDSRLRDHPRPGSTTRCQDPCSDLQCTEFWMERWSKNVDAI